MVEAAVEIVEWGARALDRESPSSLDAKRREEP